MFRFVTPGTLFAKRRDAIFAAFPASTDTGERQGEPAVCPFLIQKKIHAGPQKQITFPDALYLEQPGAADCSPGRAHGCPYEYIIRKVRGKLLLREVYSLSVCRKHIPTMRLKAKFFCPARRKPALSQGSAKKVLHNECGNKAVPLQRIFFCPKAWSEACFSRSGLLKDCFQALEGHGSLPHYQRSIDNGT